MDYWQKLSKTDKPLRDLLDWGIPEQKSGRITVLGGNSQNFSTAVRNTEFLSTLPLQSVQLILPDILRSKLPPLPHLDFVSSAESGSIARSALLNSLVSHTDFLLISGDVTKNSETSVALTSAIKSINCPLLLTRDAVDALNESAADFIERSGLFFVASLAQLQKLFRALLYPKMLLLSSPLVPILEALHKFTLTYEGVTILTFHIDQIIVASHGRVATIPIKDTTYSPLSLWSGTLACKVAALNLWNPAQEILATSAALWYN